MRNEIDAFVAELPALVGGVCAEKDRRVGQSLQPPGGTAQQGRRV